jgi:CzcA family heavy metal efflux pump
MRWIVGRSLRYHWIILFVALGVMVLGASEVPGAKVEAFPEFSEPQVQIQTIALGNSTSEVESLITVPIEEALNGIPGLARLQSKSVAQLSSIKLVFEKGTDEKRARQLVQERVGEVLPNIPTWASPPWIMPALSSTSRTVEIGMRSDSVDLIDMSAIAYWKVRERLLRVEGVSTVDIYGERLKQRHVQVDPQLMAKYHIPIEQVMQAGSEALDYGVLAYARSFTVGQGGFIEQPEKRYNIQDVQTIQNADELAQVVVAKRGGREIKMKDLGQVLQTSQQLWGEAVIDGGDGLLLVVNKTRGANTKEVTEGVDDALKDMQPGLPGIELDPTIFRPATFVDQSIDNLTRALLLGMLLVIVIITAFLFTIRTAIISLVAIPLSLVSALYVLDLREASINVMVLAGLVVAIGVVVDDAIIDVENIVRRLRESRAAGATTSTIRTILDASVEVRTAITYATLINIIAVMPVLFLAGLSGAFFRPMILSYSLAVFVSMIVAMTVTPAMCLALMGVRGLSSRPSPLLTFLKKHYGRALSKTIKRPTPAVAAALVLAIAGVVVYPSLGTELLPKFKERDFLVGWATEPSSSITEEKKVIASACRAMAKIPDVRNCGAHIGQALLGEEVAGANFGELWISIDRKADYDKVLVEIEDVVAQYPGMQNEVLTYLRERVEEDLTGSSGAVVARVSGPDPAVLGTLAKDVTDEIGDAPGIVDAHSELQVQQPQIEITLDLAKARKYGLKPGDIRRQSSAYIASEEVSDIFTNGRAYDVHVWSIPSARNSIDDIKALPIDAPSGGKIALSKVADVTVRDTPNTIQRDGQSRRVDVVTNLKPGADLGKAVSAVRSRVHAMNLPEGYTVEILGEGDELKAARTSLLVFGLLALATIFFLLQAAFSSARLAAMAGLLLPTSLVGGILAIPLASGLVSLGSLVGLLTVFGIAARNGILMISHFQHLEHEEGMEFGPELVLRGALERLAPIAMTALATGLAIVPLIVTGSAPGQEIEHPMAVVILGGLVTSTLLNLFIIPSLYLRFGKSRRELEAAPATA